MCLSNVYENSVEQKNLILSNVQRIDCKDGFLSVKGWTETSGETGVSFGKRAKALGVCYCGFTDVSRDGALSGVAASLIEAVLTRLLNRYYSGSELGYLLLENFVAVALVEELCKHWPVRRFAWKHPAFDYRFDAVVYCVFSALGFAALENILYVAQFGLSVAVPRALLSVPGHFFFAVYMGIYLGEAKRAEREGEGFLRDRFLRESILVPVLLHGFWDFSLSVDSLWMTAAFYAFVLVFFLSANHRLRAASEDDQQL